MKKFKKILKNQQGLTLVELLAVIVILGIVAAIAVPSIGNVINNSKDKAILAEASSILSGAKLAILEGACDPGVAGKLCNQAILGDKYVEGLAKLKDNTTAPTYEVTKSGNVYSVTFNKFGDINDKAKFAITNNTITEPALNTFLK
ncbi:type II secretion system protein [Psychrobacillus sp. BM2]|uniref:type II secretion system protein n=1 Tax=Psychrobacillus sp. BM2 TaxID=3400421 RepID=UPI003B017CDD